MPWHHIHSDKIRHLLKPLLTLVEQVSQLRISGLIILLSTQAPINPIQFLRLHHRVAAHDDPDDLACQVLLELGALACQELEQALL